MSKLFEWLTEKARFPRFVWVVLALGLLTVSGALAYKIWTAQHVLISATDKFNIAVDAQKEALQHREDACELLENMNKRFAEAEATWNERFDELHGHLERMKKSMPHPEIREKIEVAQMALRDERRDFNRKKTAWDLNGRMAAKK